MGVRNSVTYRRKRIAIEAIEEIIELYSREAIKQRDCVSLNEKIDALKIAVYVMKETDAADWDDEINTYMTKKPIKDGAMCER